MIHFDQINSHLKYNLLTKTTFKITCVFVKLATHTHTHTHKHTHTESDSSYESFECDPKLLD